MRGAGNLEGRVQRIRQRWDRDIIGETMQDDGARGLRFRHHFDGKLGQRRQRAIGARLQFAHVVASDVLDDLAAGLPDFAKAVHGGKAEDVVSRRSCAYAPRSGKVASDHAAKRWLALRAEKGAPVGRLEGQHLALFRELSVDRGEWLARLRGQDKFGGLVFNDSCEPRNIEDVIGFHRPAERALGAACDDFERIALRDDPGNHLRYLLGVRRFKHRHCRSPQKRGRSGNATLPACTCMRPSSAQRQSCGNTLPGLSRLSESKAHFSRCC